jgi:hypothetical protein
LVPKAVTEAAALSRGAAKAAPILGIKRKPLAISVIKSATPLEADLKKSPNFCIF